MNKIEKDIRKEIRRLAKITHAGHILALIENQYGSIVSKYQDYIQERVAKENAQKHAGIKSNVRYQ